VTDNSTVRQRDLKLFRKLLEGRKRDILQESERAVGAMNNESEEACADPTDRAALESDRNFLLRMRDRERKLLSKISEAFARLEDGSYGRCEECGGEIGIERLKARPVTTLCIACKSAQEEREQKI
jgi:DnaK suppressor protein